MGRMDGEAVYRCVLQGLKLSFQKIAAPMYLLRNSE
jgi:hypothetical protein